MHIFLGGMHGVGKTTLVNEINNDRPLAKYINIDMINDTQVDMVSQIKRITIFRECLMHMPTSINTLVDRSPYDYEIYIMNSPMPDHNKKLCMERLQEIIKLYKKLTDQVTIIVTDSFENIWDRIQKRSRNGRAELDQTWSRHIYDDFMSISANDFIFLPVQKVKSYVLNLIR